MRPQPLALVDAKPGAAGYGWLMSAVAMAATVASENWLPLTPGPARMSPVSYPRIATRMMRNDARSVRLARDFSLATLRRWGVGDLAADIEIVVSELVTNALRYGHPDPGEPLVRWPIRLGLVLPGSSVMCAVADPSSKPPVPKQLGCLAETGRGLHVIEGLCDQWGFATPSSGGKVVWALFAGLGR